MDKATKDIKDKFFSVLNDTEKMKDIIDKACDSQMQMFEWADRREELGKRMNEQQLGCPECCTRQVQLVGYINVKPAQWKCRHCKHEFEWEGE